MIPFQVKFYGDLIFMNTGRTAPPLPPGGVLQWPAYTGMLHLFDPLFQGYLKSLPLT